MNSADIYSPPISMGTPIKNVIATNAPEVSEAASVLIEPSFQSSWPTEEGGEVARRVRY